MNKLYKYWIFYIKPEYINTIACNISDRSYIYAYTDNKVFAHTFETMHDMTKFIKRKMNLSREDVNILADREMLQYLKESTLLTKNSKGEVCKRMIVLTIQEEKMVGLHTVSTLNNLLYKVSHVKIPTYILQKTFMEQMEKILFFSIVNNIETGEVDINGNYVSNLGKSTSIKLYADEMSIYIHLFHDILTGE